MKNLKKSVFVTIILVLILASNTVFAAMTSPYPNEIRFTRGVGNTCYYVDSTASAYTSYINAAAYNWEVTGHGANPIYTTAVSSNKGTHIDVYAENFTDEYAYKAYAYTTIWASDARQLSFNGTENYFYTEIMINKNMSISNYVLIHEMGHCFGLDDVNNVNSVMHWSDGGNARTVQACDNETINYLY